MPAETSFVKAKYALASDEVKAFPGEVSEPGAKTFDKFLEEHTLTYKGWSGSGTLKSGELAEQKKAGETLTLPLAATASQIIGVFSVVSSKVTTSGGALIFGDFLSAAGVGSLTLAEMQHVLLVSNGGNWLIIAGEPKREQTYSAPKAFTKAEAEAGQEVSATRPGILLLTGTTGLTIGGVTIVQSGPQYVPPGLKWKTTVATEAQTLLL